MDAPECQPDACEASMAHRKGEQRTAGIRVAVDDDLALRMSTHPGQLRVDAISGGKVSGWGEDRSPLEVS